MNRDFNNDLNELGLNDGERAKMERLLSEFRQESEKQAEKPDFFWAAQRTRIGASIRRPGVHKGLGWAATLAAVTTLVVFVAVPSQTPTHTPKNDPKVAAAHHTNADDEALLESVNETTSSSVPDALAPADILASEMDRGLEGASKYKTGRIDQ